MKFFISDPHISHQSILAFCPDRIRFLRLDKGLVNIVKMKHQEWLNEADPIKKKERKSIFQKWNNNLIQEMNQKLIDKINNTISKQDQLYILGDWAFGSSKESAKWRAKIKCQMILVKGNHDKNYDIMKNIVGFNKVIENEPIWLHDEKGQRVKKVVLSHFPYLPGVWHRVLGWFLIKLGIWEEFDNRYLHKRIQNTGEILIHGHVHSDKIVYGKKMIHVGVEALKGVPISEIEILRIIKNKGW